MTGTEHAEVHGWWWDKYRDVLKALKQRPDSGWELVDAYVSH